MTKETDDFNKVQEGFSQAEADNADQARKPDQDFDKVKEEILSKPLVDLEAFRESYKKVSKYAANVLQMEGRLMQEIEKLAGALGQMRKLVYGPNVDKNIFKGKDKKVYIRSGLILKHRECGTPLFQVIKDISVEERIENAWPLDSIIAISEGAVIPKEDAPPICPRCGAVCAGELTIE